MKKIYHTISIEEMDSMHQKGIVRYHPYADHAKFFALFDDGRTYHHRG